MHYYLSRHKLCVKLKILAITITHRCGCVDASTNDRNVKTPDCILYTCTVWCRCGGACAAWAYRNGQTNDRTPRKRTISWSPWSLIYFCVWRPCAWRDDHAAKTFDRKSGTRMLHRCPAASLPPPATHRDCSETLPILWLLAMRRHLWLLALGLSRWPSPVDCDGWIYPIDQHSIECLDKLVPFGRPYHAIAIDWRRSSAAAVARPMRLPLSSPTQ